LSYFGFSKTKITSIDLSKNVIRAIGSDVQDDKLSKTLAELFLAHETLTDFNLTGK
jgi:hypothetical protein